MVMPLCYLEGGKDTVYNLEIEGEKTMFGILIQYNYEGDEATWKAAVTEFVSNIDADPALSGKFSYQVNIAADGKGRVHVGRWDNEDTLAHLQSQDFFKAFAQKVGEFAGGAQQATRLTAAAGTVGD
jgi:quinol monooxygenase YgiN